MIATDISPKDPCWASKLNSTGSSLVQKHQDFQRLSPSVAFYGYRWYDPVTGRWPSKDPIEEMANQFQIVLTKVEFKESVAFPVGEDTTMNYAQIRLLRNLYATNSNDTTNRIDVLGLFLWFGGDDNELIRPDCEVRNPPSKPSSDCVKFGRWYTRVIAGQRVRFRNCLEAHCYCTCKCPGQDCMCTNKFCTKHPTISPLKKVFGTDTGSFATSAGCKPYCRSLESIYVCPRNP
jgi:hypothetical protein